MCILEGQSSVRGTPSSASWPPTAVPGELLPSSCCGSLTEPWESAWHASALQGQEPPAQTSPGAGVWSPEQPRGRCGWSEAGLSSAPPPHSSPARVPGRGGRIRSWPWACGGAWAPPTRGWGWGRARGCGAAACVLAPSGAVPCVRSRAGRGSLQACGCRREWGRWGLVRGKLALWPLPLGLLGCFL